MSNPPSRVLIPLNSSSQQRKTILVVIDQQSLRVVLEGLFAVDHQTFYKFYLPLRTFDSTTQAVIHGKVHHCLAAASNDRLYCLLIALKYWWCNDGLSIFFNEVVAGIGPCLGLNT